MWEDGWEEHITVVVTSGHNHMLFEKNSAGTNKHYSMNSNNNTAETAETEVLAWLADSNTVR